MEALTSGDFLDLRQQLVHLWEETTWKAAVYLARSRVAHREGCPEIGTALAQAAQVEGRYASILAEMLFPEYIQGNEYNVTQTIEREGDPGRQPETIALAERLELQPVAQLLDQLLATRLVTAKRLRGLWEQAVRRSEPG